MLTGGYFVFTKNVFSGRGLKYSQNGIKKITLKICVINEIKWSAAVPNNRSNDFCYHSIPKRKNLLYLTT